MGMTEELHYLRKEHQFFRLLLDTMPSAVFSTDKNGLVNSWNRKAEEITGYRAEEVLGQTCKIFFCNPCLIDSGIVSLEDYPSCRNERCAIRTKTGETITVSKGVEQLLGEHGEVIGKIECFEDITARLQMEEALRESKRAAEQANEMKSLFYRICPMRSEHQ